MYGRFGSGIGGPGGPLINPSAQQPNLFGAQSFALGRHLQIGNRPGDEVDQRTISALAGADGWGVILASLEGGRPVLQAQAAPLFVEAVAGYAVRGEDRPDIALEVHGPLGGGR